MAKRTIPPEPSSAQEKSSSFRQLKVRKSYYHYQHGDFQPRHRHVSSPPVPWVQIKGYWLNQAGFTIGTPLSVEVQLSSGPKLPPVKHLGYIQPPRQLVVGLA